MHTMEPVELCWFLQVAAEAPAPAQPEEGHTAIAAAAMAPKHAAINPQLLPQVETQCKVQAASLLPV